MSFINIVNDFFKRENKTNFDGVARLFNLFLEYRDLPQDCVLDRIVSIKDRLVKRDYAFTENDLHMLPIVSIMVLLKAQATIEDSPEGEKKQLLISDLLEFEDFLKLSPHSNKETSMEF